MQSLRNFERLPVMQAISGKTAVLSSDLPVCCRNDFYQKITFFNDDEGSDYRTWLALNRNDASVIKLKQTSCETNGYRTNMF